MPQVGFRRRRLTGAAVGCWSLSLLRVVRGRRPGCRRAAGCRRGGRAAPLGSGTRTGHLDRRQALDVDRPAAIRCVVPQARGMGWKCRRSARPNCRSGCGRGRRPCLRTTRSAKPRGLSHQDAPSDLTRSRPAARHERRLQGSHARRAEPKLKLVSRVRPFRRADVPRRRSDLWRRHHRACGSGRRRGARARARRGFDRPLPACLRRWLRAVPWRRAHVAARLPSWSPTGGHLRFPDPSTAPLPERRNPAGSRSAYREQGRAT